MARPLSTEGSYTCRYVRSSTHHDLLNELQAACFPSDCLESPSRGHWWILYHGETPAGFASIRDVQGEPSLGYLSRSGLLPAHRGKGLQKRLIKVRLRQARRVGWKRVVSSTYKNIPSANNLISCGFRLYRPTVPWGASGTLYWIKEVS